MRPPRFSVRRVMVVVAVVALGLGICREGTRLMRLRHEYALREATHSAMSMRAAALAEVSQEAWRADVLRLAQMFRGIEGDGIAAALTLAPAPPAIQAKLARYHQELNVKYLRAQRRPWIPVEPDPPAPTWDRKWVP